MIDFNDNGFFARLKKVNNDNFKKRKSIIRY